MVRKNGLGKGLDSLIPSTGHKKAAPAKPEVKKEVVVEKVIKKEEVMVKITEVEPNREQPRKNFNEDALLELADSIKQFGIIQPLVVQKQDNYYEIIAGERRWRAAKLAGLKEVPVIIKNYTEQERVEIALIENIQRKDLHYFEEAAAIAAYLRQSGVTQEEAAALLGRSPSALANKLRLLRLSPDCRKLLVENGLSERHARALLRLDDPEERLSALRHIIRAGLNVAPAEQYVGRRLEALQATPPAGRRTFILKDVRLFLNTIRRSMGIMQRAGVDAACEREDTDEEIRLTIRIPRTGAAKTA